MALSTAREKPIGRLKSSDGGFVMSGDVSSVKTDSCEVQKVSFTDAPSSTCPNRSGRFETVSHAFPCLG